jgi:hypothetical protein
VKSGKSKVESDKSSGKLMKVPGESDESKYANGFQVQVHVNFMILCRKSSEVKPGDGSC